MLRTKVTTWLLLLFAFLLRPSKCLASTCQETDHPNLDHAMVGFDPFLANAYEQFDPGFRNRIFEPTGEVFASKFNTYSLPNEFSNYLSCALQFTSTVLSNFTNYEIEKERRFFPRQEANDERNRALNEANVRDVSSCDLEEDTEENIIREFYLETNGEIVQSKITCIAQELRLPPFSRPAFTADFSAALQTLQLAAKKSETEYSKKIYREFVDMYGTHYIKKSKMGAEIIFQKLFTTKDMDDNTKHARQNCINSYVQRSIANDAISFEAVIADLSEISEDCDYSGGREYFSNSGIESSRVIINGPPPIGTVEQWSTAVKRFPVPISFEVEKIHALFLRNSIESSLTRADGESLCEATSGILLYNLFESMYSSYCVQMGGRHCSPEIVNFGANSGCPPGSTCNKVSGTSDAYECETPPYGIGGVIVTGGYGGSSKLDVETINTWQLPNLPIAVYLHTLSQVGPHLYCCGGQRVSKVTDVCHTLDLSSRPPVWKSSPNMPKPMHGHAAVTIGSHIWFTHSNELYDFSNEEQLFRTYNLPMVVSRFHCAVSNDTHSYIIGAGADRREIWINKHSSRPEEWLLVAHLSSGRQYQGCLWFKDNVIIAGGYRSGSQLSDVQLLNTDTNSVTGVGSLLQVRNALGMFVLDGEPAVVGGRYSDAGVFLDTVETFNLNSRTWRANDRKLPTVNSGFALVQLR